MSDGGDNGLPEGWTESDFRGILSILETGSRPRGGVRGIADGVPSLGGEHLNDSGGFDFTNTRFVPFEYFHSMSRGHIEHGDILIVKDGATTGKTSLVRNEFPFERAVINEHVFRCRVRENVDPRFVFWFLWSQKGQRRILENFQGSAQGGINQSFAEATALPLAPLAEQRRIVAKVEELLGRVQSARERLARVPLLLKRFRETLLTAACNGQLTADWRAGSDSDTASSEYAAVLAARTSTRGTAEPIEGRETVEEAIPSEWVCAKSEELFRIIDYRGRNPKKATSGKRLITAKNIKMGYLSDTPIEWVTEQTYREWMTRGFPKVGDVFFVTEGATMGYVAINDRSDDFALAQRTLTLQPWSDGVLARFQFYYMMSPEFQHLVSLNASGSAAVGIKGARFRDLPFPFPPLAEQHEIVRRVDALFKLADAVERRVREAAARADRLTQAILAKAFRGELVPIEADLARTEHRDYEPAAQLLARIQAAQPAATPAKSKRRKSPGGRGSRRATNDR